MNAPCCGPEEIRTLINQSYPQESRRVLASLVRITGNFDLAEDALQEAYRAALEQWPAAGLPTNRVAWLVSIGRFKAIDAMRKASRQVPLHPNHEANLTEPDLDTYAGEDLQDDSLRLIFACCLPSLSPEAQVALTLREVCGLTTEEIARAFLIPAPTVAQRIVRAKAKIRDADKPFSIPDGAELPSRLQSVLRVVYLVFNEGYSAPSKPGPDRADLEAEAIRLARLILELLPAPEVMGLLGLMLLHQSRRSARIDAQGDLIPLDEQDRQQWDQALIAEGTHLTTQALASGSAGSYSLQAAISAVHAAAPEYADTDWNEIAGLYRLLYSIEPSPVIELNAAVAIGMRDGPAAGLRLIEDLVDRGELADYHLVHCARADCLRRLGQTEAAINAYQRARERSREAAEQRFIDQKIHFLTVSG